MTEWITGNIGTILAALILAAVVYLAAASVIRDKRNGRSACGSGCACCPMAGACHRKSCPAASRGQVKGLGR